MDFTPPKEKIGEFKLNFNREKSPYYLWTEQNLYLFGYGHYSLFDATNPNFDIPNGDVTTIKNELHVNIGSWIRQKDNSIFVSIDTEKLGFVLIKDNTSENYFVYWAVLVFDETKNSLEKLAFQAKKDLIKNNP